MKVAVGWIISFALVFSSGLFIGYDYRDTKANEQMSGLAATYAKATATASEEARAKEQVLQQSVDALSKQVKTNETRKRGDELAVDGTTRGLLNAAARGLSSASCDPGIARRGEAATRAAALYSELLEGSQRVAKELARTADERGDAGSICEAYGDTIGGKR